MDINDIGLQLCGKLANGEKLAPEIVKHLRLGLKDVSKDQVRDALSSLPSDMVKDLYFQYMQNPQSGEDSPSYVFVNGLSNAYPTGLTDADSFLMALGDLS